jgi:hypothetical protein
MAKTILQKHITGKECLKHIGYSITDQDLPDNFSGEMTLTFRDDHSVDVYITISTDDDDDDMIN